MKHPKNITIGISIGDLNGIGGEIILKTFEDPRILDFCTPVIFSSIKVMQFLKAHFKTKIHLNSIHKFDQIIPRKVNVFNCWKEPVSIHFGQADPQTAQYAIRSLEAAVKALKQSDIDALVTAPIDKHTVQSEQFQFPGHTDYLAQQLAGEPLMFLISEQLRVGLLTDHVPLEEVVAHITPERIEQKITTVRESLIKDFGISKPKIAVLGINPHTGDHGVIGTADDTVMRPTLKKIREQHNLVFGPYAADSFFGSNHYLQFDAIIASYHDQGLTPFKTLTFGQGVNFTSGLSAVRTSPDHGTAYDIAGQGIADPSSFKEALFSAIHIFKNRNDYKALTAHKNR